MLKAVRFDEKKHKDIIEFFSNFKDKNNRINESEGIRFLMELGYQELTKPQAINSDPPDLIEDIKETENPFNILNVGDLKEELRKQILEELKELQSSNQTITESKHNINIENLKKELLNDVMTQVNSKTLDNLTSLIDKLSNIQPVYVQSQSQSESTTQFTEINTSNTPIESKKTIDIPADINPLLANLLSNANR